MAFDFHPQRVGFDTSARTGLVACPDLGTAQVPVRPEVSKGPFGLGMKGAHA
jgi:hypothetical protein